MANGDLRSRSERLVQPRGSRAILRCRCLGFPRRRERASRSTGRLSKPSMSHKPITLVKFAADKAPTELSLSNVTVSFNRFDKSFKPELVWTGTSFCR